MLFFFNTESHKKRVRCACEWALFWTVCSQIKPINNACAFKPRDSYCLMRLLFAGEIKNRLRIFEGHFGQMVKKSRGSDLSHVIGILWNALGLLPRRSKIQNFETIFPKVTYGYKFEPSFSSPFCWTHLLPMHPFSNPWKHQKSLRFSDVFRR